ncbi:hypothetical protein NPIL_479521 [Nephila pilipes]|uniref:Uncharacterized protein n=1 Tax=Nephila pilipes TaxID=299642 RepID=A0A8X6UTY0_NEPPI|nr:hypothetical protein NPIL_479521 [Nephila pilipes]
MEQDSNPDRSNYENFHNQFNIESIVQMMDNAYTAEALTRVINVADATLSALFKYPFEDDEKQRKNIKDLEDIIDESRNRYITARRSELRAAAAALDDTAQAWGKKIMDDNFTIVKAKKKSSKSNLEYSAKKQKIDEATPCYNKFDRLTIEDVPTTSGNEMDVSPPSPTARKNSTPPQSPRRRTPQQHSTGPSTSSTAPGTRRKLNTPTIAEEIVKQANKFYEKIWTHSNPSIQEQKIYIQAIGRFPYPHQSMYREEAIQNSLSFSNT